MCLSALAGCRHASAVSAEKAKDHVQVLAQAIEQDLGEVRRGLPRGAELLRPYFLGGKFEDATAARETLDRARNKVQDLRVAKPTFFALVDLQGKVIRSDQGPDLLAGKDLFAAFPALREAIAKNQYVETRGRMPEAAAVRGRGDGQWVAAAPVSAEGQVKGLYAAGWSWSAYAYRLENQLRGQVRSALKENEHEPLVYVYVLVDNDVFGAPVSPDVNAKAIADRHFMGSAQNTAVVGAELEITGREFGAAFRRITSLGPNVGIAVLRSET